MKTSKKNVLINTKVVFINIKLAKTIWSNEWVLHY